MRRICGLLSWLTTLKIHWKLFLWIQKYVNWWTWRTLYPPMVSKSQIVNVVVLPPYRTKERANQICRANGFYMIATLAFNEFIDVVIHNFKGMLTQFSPMFHFCTPWKLQKTFGGQGFSANIYLFKDNKRSTRYMCKMCSKLTIKTLKQRHWRRFGVFIFNFEHMSHLFPVFLLVTLNK